jgi:hypothetical protein
MLEFINAGFFNSEFIMLIGQILIIVILQTIIETFFEKEKHAVQLRIINIACILGSFYLLIEFIFGHILNQITDFVKLPFL